MTTTIFGGALRALHRILYSKECFEPKSKEERAMKKLGMGLFWILATMVLSILPASADMVKMSLQEMKDTAAEAFYKCVTSQSWCAQGCHTVQHWYNGTLYASYDIDGDPAFKHCTYGLQWPFSNCEDNTWLKCGTKNHYVENNCQYAAEEEGVYTWGCVC